MGRLALPLTLLLCLGASRAGASETVVTARDDRDGVFFMLNPRLVMLSGGLFASGEEASFSRALLGGGTGLDVVLGHSLARGTAFGLQVSTLFAGATTATEVPHASVAMMAMASLGAVLEGWIGPQASIHYALGLGVAWSHLFGGRTDIGAPDNLLSFESLWGPKLHARLGWNVWSVVELGIDLDVAYVWGPGTTSLLPVILSGRASMLIF